MSPDFPSLSPQPRKLKKRKRLEWLKKRNQKKERRKNSMTPSLRMSSKSNLLARALVSLFKFSENVGC
jgi:hypothetical protein